MQPDNDLAWCHKGIVWHDYKIGLALNRLKEFENAIVCFDEGIRLRPDNYGLWYNKGI